jgi:hypothetical protein
MLQACGFEISGQWLVVSGQWLGGLRSCAAGGQCHMP